MQHSSINDCHVGVYLSFGGPKTFKSGRAGGTSCSSVLKNKQTQYQYTLISRGSNQRSYDGDDDENDCDGGRDHLVDRVLGGSDGWSHLDELTLLRHQVRLWRNPEQRRRFGRLRRHLRRSKPLPHHLRQGLLQFQFSHFPLRYSYWKFYTTEISFWCITEKIKSHFFCYAWKKIVIFMRCDDELAGVTFVDSIWCSCLWKKIGSNWCLRLCMYIFCISCDVWFDGFCQHCLLKCKWIPEHQAANAYWTGILMMVNNYGLIWKTFREIFFGLHKHLKCFM